MGITGLVLGILGAVGAFIPVVNFFSWVLCVIGIVVSAIGMSKAKKDGKPTGSATAGLVLSIIGLVIAMPFAICAICVSTAATAAAAGLTGAAGELQNLGAELEQTLNALESLGTGAASELQNLGTELDQARSAIESLGAGTATELQNLGTELDQARNALESLRGIGGSN